MSHSTDETTLTAPLAWSDAFVLGYTPMDQVHEEFVGLLEQLQQADDARFLALFDAMAAHTRAHFEQEDRWMEETTFPPRQCHIDEHAAVMKSIVEVRESLAQGEFEEGRRLVAALADWFPGHADYLDSALAHWMCKQRLGGKPVVLRRDLSLQGSRVDAA